MSTGIIKMGISAASGSAIFEALGLIDFVLWPIIETPSSFFPGNSIFLYLEQPFPLASCSETMIYADFHWFISKSFGPFLNLFFVYIRIFFFLMYIKELIITFLVFYDKFMLITIFFIWLLFFISD